MKKVGNKEENLIHCLNLISDGGVIWNRQLKGEKNENDFNFNNYLICY